MWTFSSVKAVLFPGSSVLLSSVHQGPGVASLTPVGAPTFGSHGDCMSLGKTRSSWSEVSTMTGVLIEVGNSDTEAQGDATTVESQVMLLQVTVSRNSRRRGSLGHTLPHGLGGTGLPAPCPPT